MNHLRVTSFLAFLALITFATGCASTQGNQGNEVVATVNGEPITLEELENAASGQLRRVEQDRYEVLREALDGVIEARLIAQAAAEVGMTPDEYRVSEIDGKITEPTPEEVQAYWNENQDAAPPGATFELVRDQIPRYMKRFQREDLQEALLSSVREDAQIQITYEAPRVDLDIPPGSPTRGSDDAPLTLVEYGDFECPYCRQYYTTIERLLMEYRDEIKFVYQDYPIPIHERAVPASEAARCADDQGLFWDYYANLMLLRGNLSDGDLLKRAADVGLDTAQFSACLQSDRYTEAIEASLGRGRSLGISGTPTFFLNGRMISGAKPYDVLKEIVEEELARATGGAG